MVRVSQEWYDARMEVLDDFWINKIDFEKFKEGIKEVDKEFKEKKVKKVLKK